MTNSVWNVKNLKTTKHQSHPQVHVYIHFVIKSKKKTRAKKIKEIKTLLPSSRA